MREDDLIGGKQSSNRLPENEAIAQILMLSDAVSESLETREVAKTALNCTARLFKATAGDITVTGMPAETRSIWAGGRGSVYRDHFGENAPRLSKRLSTRIAKTGKPSVVEFNHTVAQKVFSTGKIAHLAVIPLIARGRCSGVITIGCGEESGLDRIDMGLLESIGKITGTALENSRIFFRLKAVSDTDACTGLYNRRFIMRKLESEIQRSNRYGRKMAAMMIDIDRFKEINDRFGHLFGDHVLRKTGLALVSACRATDYIGRYGGDEFMAVLPEAGKKDAEIVRGRAKNRLRDLRIKGPGDYGYVSIEASFGIAVHPHTGMTKKELIEAADQDLYAFKRRHKNQLSGPQAA